MTDAHGSGISHGRSSATVRSVAMPGVEVGLIGDPLREELNATAKSELIKRAKEMGVSDEDIDKAIDSQKIKNSLIDLIVKAKETENRNSGDLEPDCSWPLYATIMGIFFVEVVGTLLVLPLLAIIAKDLNATNWELGLIAGTMPFALALSQIMWGILADYVTRKPLILLCCGGCAVAYLMTGMAQTVWFLVLSRFVTGIFGGNSAVISVVLFANSPERFRDRDLINIYATINLSLLAAPALAALVLSLGFSWRGVLFIAACCPAIILPLAAFFIPNDKQPTPAPAEIEISPAVAEEKKDEDEKPEDPVKMFFHYLLQSRTAFLILCGHFLSWGSYGMIQAVMVVVNKEVFEFDEKSNMLVWSVAGLCSLIAVKAVDVLKLAGPRGALLICGTGKIFALLLILGVFRFFPCETGKDFPKWESKYCIPHAILPFIFSSIFWAVGLQMPPSYLSLWTKPCPPQALGTAMGFINFMQMMGEALGPLFGGKLLDYGIWMPYQVSLIFHVLMYFCIPMRNPKSWSELQAEKEEADKDK